MSPSARTLKVLRDQGFMVGVVERFNRFGGKFGIRQDLFNLFDLAAAKEGEGIIGVQCGVGSGHQAHKRKICEEHRDNAEKWLKAGGRILIYSWRKLKTKRGSKKYHWVPIVEEITLENLSPQSLPVIH